MIPPCEQSFDWKKLYLRYRDNLDIGIAFIIFFVLGMFWFYIEGYPFEAEYMPNYILASLIFSAIMIGIGYFIVRLVK